MKFPAGIAALLVATVIGLGASASPASAGLVTGVSYVSEGDSLTFERVKGAGASMVHTWVRWNIVAPATEPDSWNPRNPTDPHYDWSQVDEWVTNATAAGLTPLLQVYYSPTWANRCKAPEKYAITKPPCNPDPSAMADFGYALAKRYDGSTLGLPRVRFFQAQNEPNLSLFFYPQFNKAGQPISPAIYRVLLNRFYEAVKSVHRSNKVLSAGLAPNGNSSAVAPLVFARKLLCMTGRTNPKPTKAKCAVKLDIFDMHPYTSGGPTHKASGPDNVQIGDLGKLKRLLKAADRAGRIKGDGRSTPLWVTEMSWDSKGPDPRGVPMNLLKRWTSEAVFRTWKAGVSHFFWYSLRDQDPGSLPYSYTAQSGLYFRGPSVEQDRAKPILQAFQFPFVAYPKGRKQISVWGRNLQKTGGWVSIQRFRNGKWQKLKPVRANGGGLFNSVIGYPGGGNRVGKVRAVFRGKVSVPFSLKKFRDRPARPFG